ncbi:MAG: holo-ACP synthase [Syntrophomonadaceae bacterium]|nr:holo-ACP synthase [Syntrophomonadaceae bacterium]
MLLVGVDIVEIERVRRVALRVPRFQRRLFTPSEQEECAGRADPFPSLAARFAAKEAFLKLHPELAAGVGFREIEVLRGPLGKPLLRASGRALENLRALRVAEIDVSLSHSRSHAVAVVVARGER